MQKNINKDNCLNGLLEFISEQIELIDFLYYKIVDANNIIVSADYLFSFEKIILSSKKTLEAIYICVENYIIADSFILLRKYRDNLLLYLILKNEKLSIKISSDFIKLANNKKFKSLNETFNIVTKYTNINKQLNNFVHNNGISYLNYNITSYKKYNLTDLISSKFKDYISFFNLTFLTFIAQLNPINITSTDYIDALELGIHPLEGSQYFVAPLLAEYFEKYQNILGPSFTTYLHENNGFIFNNLKSTSV